RLFRIAHQQFGTRAQHRAANVGLRFRLRREHMLHRAHHSPFIEAADVDALAEAVEAPDARLLGHAQRGLRDAWEVAEGPQHQQPVKALRLNVDNFLVHHEANDFAINIFQEHELAFVDEGEAALWERIAAEREVSKQVYSLIRTKCGVYISRRLGRELKNGRMRR